jgi:ATP-binding cassette, subfamily C, bacterial CydD
MRPVDPRLLRHARAARGHLLTVVILGLATSGLILAQAGLPARARAQRQWRLLARLGGHFLDVVEGLTTLKVFGRAGAQAEAIERATDAHRGATMSVLRVAFVSALVRGRPPPRHHHPERCVPDLSRP